MNQARKPDDLKVLSEALGGGGRSNDNDSESDDEGGTALSKNYALLAADDAEEVILITKKLAAHAIAETHDTPDPNKESVSTQTSATEKTNLQFVWGGSGAQSVTVCQSTPASGPRSMSYSFIFDDDIIC